MSHDFPNFPALHCSSQNFKSFQFSLQMKLLILSEIISSPGFLNEHHTMSHIFLQHFIFLALSNFIALFHEGNQILNKLASDTIIPKCYHSSYLAHISEIDLLLFEVNALQIASNPFLDNNTCLFLRHRRFLFDWDRLSFGKNLCRG